MILNPSTLKQDKKFWVRIIRNKFFLYQSILQLMSLRLKIQKTMSLIVFHLIYTNLSKLVIIYFVYIIIWTNSYYQSQHSDMKLWDARASYWNYVIVQIILGKKLNMSQHVLGGNKNIQCPIILWLYDFQWFDWSDVLYSCENTQMLQTFTPRNTKLF